MAQGWLRVGAAAVTWEVSSGVYPAVVFHDAGVILGIEAGDTLGMRVPGTAYRAVHVDHRTQIYTHHVVRELVRAGRDAEALAVGRASQGYAYWGHVLELLVHSVLDNESDHGDVLPRVIAYTAHFSEHLDALAHTARKTEVALWATLFAHADSPRALFEECMRRGKLHTAASYLVILQSLESPALSRQQATRLLHAALDADQWQLARDLMRFLAAIADDKHFADEMEMDVPGQRPVAVADKEKGRDLRSVGVQTDSLPNADQFFIDVVCDTTST
jgi:hypothetical protein